MLSVYEEQEKRRSARGLSPPGDQLVANPLDRYNINASTKRLQFNEDGSEIPEGKYVAPYVENLGPK